MMSFTGTLSNLGDLGKRVRPTFSPVVLTSATKLATISCRKGLIRPAVGTSASEDYLQPFFCEVLSVLVNIAV